MSSFLLPLATVQRQSLRLLGIGDCNTSGMHGEPTEHLLLPRLAAALRAHAIDCEIQDLGYQMSTTREGVARMRRDARTADIVLLNFGLVDAWITSLPQLYVSYYPDNLLKRLLRKSLKFAKRGLRSPLLRRFIPVGEVVGVDEFETNVRAMIESARDANPNVRVILWGTAGTRGSQSRNDNIERYNQRLRAITHSAPGLHYVDAAAILRDLPAEAVYTDVVHLTVTARDRLIDVIVGLILSGFGRQVAA